MNKRLADMSVRRRAEPAAVAHAQALVPTNYHPRHAPHMEASAMAGHTLWHARWHRLCGLAHAGRWRALGIGGLTAEPALSCGCTTSRFEPAIALIRQLTPSGRLPGPADQNLATGFYVQHFNIRHALSRTAAPALPRPCSTHSFRANLSTPTRPFWPRSTLSAAANAKLQRPKPCANPWRMRHSKNSQNAGAQCTHSQLCPMRHHCGLVDGGGCGSLVHSRHCEPTQCIHPPASTALRRGICKVPSTSLAQVRPPNSTMQPPSCSCT